MAFLNMEKDLVKELGFELVHDGAKDAPPGQIRSFIRRYRKGSIEVVVRHDTRSGTGDISRVEWHNGARENFKLDHRPHKNGRDYLTLEGLN